MIIRTIVAAFFGAWLTGCGAARPPALVYVAGPTHDLFLIEPDSQTVTPLTGRTEQVEADPCLSVDRSRVAYVIRQADGGAGLNIMNLDGDAGRSIEPIYRSDNPLFTPAWSNNGKRIAFVELVDDRFMLRLINADGNGLQDAGFGSSPSWRMDDRAVFFSSRDTPAAPAGDLMVRELKTGLTQPLALRGNGFTNLQRAVSIVFTKLPYSRRNEAVWLIDANNRQTRLSEPNRDYRDVDPVHINGTPYVAFTRIDIETDNAMIYVVDRTSDDPVAVPLLTGEGPAYTRGGERIKD